MAFHSDEDEDDDFAPSTPHNIRHRNALPPPKPRLKRNTASQPKQTRPLKQQRPLQERATSLHSSQSNILSPQGNPTKPASRNGIAGLSLRKPMAIAAVAELVSSKPPPQTNIETQQQTTEGIIVLDSETEAEQSDQEMYKTINLPADSGYGLGQRTQFGGATAQSSSHLADYPRPQSVVDSQDTYSKFTQESISSSQGSVDGNAWNGQLSATQDQQPENVQDLLDDTAEEYGGYPLEDEALYYSAQVSMNCGDDKDRHEDPFESRWSLSPEVTNPYLSDLVASTSTVAPELAKCGTGSPSPLATSSTKNTLLPQEASAEVTTCLLCSKDISHLDAKRMDYHINSCLDKQLLEQQTTESMDLASSVDEPSGSQVRFAGGQVDYLYRVKQCPICKLDWPLNGKSSTKAASSIQPRKARQKVEHMKRCAKAHRRTPQSLLYQIRMLKERYERSQMLGTSMDSDPITPSQELLGVPDADMVESLSVKKDKVEEIRSVRAKPAAQPSTIRTQVISLTDAADADFTSDAIITSIHTPVQSRPKVSKLYRMQEDQEDEGLQLALAISLSMHNTSESRTGSPLDESTTAFGAASLSSHHQKRGTGKRRKLTEREKNETTILPFAEVQELIQANVVALLFPEVEYGGPGANRADEDGPQTPPWRPSRFSADGSSALQSVFSAPEVLSQSSEPASPTKRSLWELSRLKDTREIESLDLDAETNSTTTTITEPKDGGLSNATHLVLHNPYKTVVKEIAEDLAPGFDREQYVSRFMRRYITDQRRTTSNGVSSMAGSRASSHHGTSHGTSEPVVPVESQERDNKFSSPLWSAVKGRRTSLMAMNRALEQEKEERLKREIMAHLEDMERNVQMLKRETFAKIIASLEAHSRPRSLFSPEKDKDAMDTQAFGWLDLDEEEDHSDKDADGYQQPSSPLLRYSKPPTTFESSPSDHRLAHQSPHEHSHTADTSVPHIVEDFSFELEQEDYDYGTMTGGQDYSPRILPHRSECGREASVTVSIDPTTRSDNTALGRDRLLLTSSPCDLPPPLDLSSMGIRHSFNGVRAVDSSTVKSLPAGPSRSELSMSSPVRDDDISFDMDEISSRWKDVTTPKKSRRNPGGVENHSGGKSPVVDEDDNDDSLMMSMPPRRPKSAVRTRTGIYAPHTTSEAASSIGKGKRPGVLHGLPLKPSVVARAVTIEAEEDEEMEMVQDDDGPLSDSQPPASVLARSQTSQVSVQTPTRKPRGRTSKDTLTPTTATISLSQPVAEAPPGTKTPSKKKRVAVRRAEASAAESAKLVAQYKARRSMPDYKNMTVPTLRVAAMTFGLKATSKQALVDQLTAIWKSLNPGRAAQDDGGDEEEEGGGGRDVDEDGTLVGESDGGGGGTKRGEGSRRVRQGFVWRDLDSEVFDDEEEDEHFDVFGSSMPADIEAEQSLSSILQRVNGRGSNRIGHKSRTDETNSDGSTGISSWDRQVEREYSPIVDMSDVEEPTFPSMSQPRPRPFKKKTDVRATTGGSSSTALTSTSSSCSTAFAGHKPLSIRNPGDQEPQEGGGNSRKRTQPSTYVDLDKEYGSDRSSEVGFEEHDIGAESNGGQDDDEEEDEDGEESEPEGQEINPKEEDVASVITPSSLERQLHRLFRTEPNLRRQYLTYKPLDLELVWGQCQQSHVLCTRQELRQFMDKHGLICVVPAHSALGSWRKTAGRKKPSKKKAAAKASAPAAGGGGGGNSDGTFRTGREKRRRT